jgi:hypothetical protein
MNLIESKGRFPGWFGLGQKRTAGCYATLFVLD